MLGDIGIMSGQTGSYLRVLGHLLERGGLDRPVSGGSIGDALGLSRAAVWKGIKKLRGLGFRISGVPSKGYVIRSTPDLLVPPLVKNELRTDTFGHDYHYFPKTDSTNLRAKLLASHLQTGSLIVAEEQTQGQGRFKRHWLSPFGGIYMSLFLRPPLPPDVLGTITLVMGLAIARAIDESTDLRTAIKWPNDILIGNKKICGVLTWMSADLDRAAWVIVGAGLNVNIGAEFFSGSELDHASSLSAIAGRDFSRVSLISNILEKMEVVYERYINDGLSVFLPEIRKRDPLLGREIKIKTLTEVLEGVGKGIDEKGSLILGTHTGDEVSVTTGDVSILKNVT